MTILAISPMLFCLSAFFNIGLQKGVIGPTLFSMMVLMAIVTTMMASPLFEIVYGRKARQSGELKKLEGSMVADAA